VNTPKDKKIAELSHEVERLKKLLVIADLQTEIEKRKRIKAEQDSINPWRTPGVSWGVPTELPGWDGFWARLNNNYRGKHSE